MTASNSVIKNQFAISQFNEYYLPSINRNTFEKVDSTTVFKQKFKQDIFTEDTLHIIVGLDSGLLVNYIIEAPKTEGSKYLFVELPEVMTMLNIDLPEKQKEYLDVMSFDEFSKIIQSSHHNLFLVKNQVKVTLSLSASSGVIEDYSVCYNNICKLLSQKSSSLKANLNQKLFFAEQLLNASENQQPATILKNTFSGKTCVIVGGGPSLDEQLDWLKLNYDKLFIITVSRCASKLSLLGIPAHIIVSIDPQEHSFEVNREMMGLAHESLLVNSHHICHRILAQWQGRSVFLGEQLPWIDSNNIPTVGPTVTNSSIRIAIEMGFSQILLTGVDFCHSSTGLTHTKGSVEAASGSDNSRINQWVETYAGNLAETPMSLFHAANALQQEATAYPKTNIINLSINAAKIDGIQHIDVKNIKIEPVSCTIKQFIENLPQKRQKESQFFYSLEKELRAAKRSLNKIHTLSKEALSLISTAKKYSVKSDEYQQKIAGIERIESKINNQHSSFSKLIKIYGYFEFSQFLTTKETNDWSEEQMNSMTNKYYQAFEIMSKELNELVQQSLELVTVRKEELKERPSFVLLSTTWFYFNQPGRVYLWINNAGKQIASNLPQRDNEVIIKLQNSYKVQLESRAHPYFSMKKKNQVLTNTLAKIIDLKQSKNIAGLKLLATNLRPLISVDQYASRLFHLTQYFTFFLKNEFESALNSILSIEESNRSEVEHKQILLIAFKLHNLDLAEKTLNELVKYSDEYQPQHAHILSLKGENQQALDKYLNYLDKYPTDENTLIKLGIFLANIGQTEGARSSFSQVLSI
ncbi:6-hydroxymethylpterin diphosphokinase MptE-like protein, partial [Shewanella sp. KT0246]|uniref:6-hydroxymethylpterin diphosphokinase MptE-like protein n=1 Tax=Shewanella sp. KT0246 TaxID=2815912 RepID=UPI001C7D7026